MPTPKFTLLARLALLTPILLIGGHLICEPLMTLSQKQALLGENGPHEIAEFLILVAAALVALKTLLTMNRKGDVLLTAWVAIALICCIYVAGEEVSWGQWFFYWDTPEQWAALNDQGETNLHNTSAWLDQKPRLLLELGIYIGGLIIAPLYLYRPHRLPARFALFYPHITLLPLAAGVLATKTIQTLFDTFYRSSEIQELMLFLFVLLYLLMIQARIHARDIGMAAAPQ